MRRRVVVAVVAVLLLMPQVCLAGSKAEIIVEAINVQYGNVCHAELTGWFTKTLKLDWTPRTTKLHMLGIMAAIGRFKRELYEDGVRYLQIPNNIGTYNVFDWKTGEKRTISDRAPYYFRK